VIGNREGVFVVDITVRHEDGDYLEKGRLEKDREILNAAALASEQI
jgi:hypothetical protein